MSISGTHKCKFSITESKNLHSPTREGNFTGTKPIPVNEDQFVSADSIEEGDISEDRLFEAFRVGDYKKAKEIASKLYIGTKKEKILKEIGLGEALNKQDWRKAREIAKELRGRIGELEVDAIEIRSKSFPGESLKRFTEIQIEIFKLKVEQVNPKKIGDSTPEEIFSSLIRNKTIRAPIVNKDNLNSAIKEFNTLQEAFFDRPYGLSAYLNMQDMAKFYYFMSVYAENIATNLDKDKDTLRRKSFIDSSNEYKKSFTKFALSFGTGRSILPEEKIREIQNYINQNQENLPNVLSRLLRDYQFVLIGESHLPVCYGLSSDVGNTLTRLAKETKARKENLIIALEINSKVQNFIDKLDYSLSDDELMKKLHDKWHETHELPEESRKAYLNSLNINHTQHRNTFKVLIEAKRAGLKVVCVDKATVDLADQDQANAREEFMFKNIISQVSPNTKVIFYGGAAHASTAPVTLDKVIVGKLGSLLSSKFPKKVASLRSANWFVGFNYDNTGSTLISLMSEYQNSVVVPTGGPFRTEQGTYDYIVIDPAPVSRR
jgi:hypothetical protein